MIVMTMMVRDEADVVQSMIEHHRDQGVDKLIVTYNGSVDGTIEILQSFAEEGFVELRHDLVHRKQQSVRVTEMARDAYGVYGADWVLNADADEFWMPRDRSITLREALAQVSKEVVTFPVPVVDMTGLPGRTGNGLDRLVYRDERSNAQLAAVGLHAHSTSNVAHIGSPAVEVVQGNHFVNLEARGEIDPRFGLEVLHVPWRSWDQFRRKVENAGRAYDANPDLTPSPNHHGMREWRRLKEGTLFAWYLLRHPSTSEIRDEADGGVLTFDDVLASRATTGTAIELDDEIAGMLESLRASEHHQQEQLERERFLVEEINSLTTQAGVAAAEISSLEAARDAALQHVHELRSRRVVRMLDRIGRLRAR